MKSVMFMYKHSENKAWSLLADKIFIFSEIRPFAFIKTYGVSFAFVCKGT